MYYVYYTIDSIACLLGFTVIVPTSDWVNVEGRRESSAVSCSSIDFNQFKFRIAPERCWCQTLGRNARSYARPCSTKYQESTRDL